MPGQKPLWRTAICRVRASRLWPTLLFGRYIFDWKLWVVYFVIEKRGVGFEQKTILQNILVCAVDLLRFSHTAWFIHGRIPGPTHALLLANFGCFYIWMFVSSGGGALTFGTCEPSYWGWDLLQNKQCDMEGRTRIWNSTLHTLLIWSMSRTSKTRSCKYAMPRNLPPDSSCGTKKNFDFSALKNFANNPPNSGIACNRM